MKKLVLTLTAVCLSWGIAFGAASPEPVALPENVVGIVEAPNLETFQTHLQAYSDAVEPGEDLTDPVALTLTKLTKTHALEALNLQQPIRILFIKSGEGTIATVTVVSAVTAQDFFGAILPMVQETGVQDGIHSYIENKHELDNEAYEKATPEEKQNFQAFMKTTTQPFFIGESGTTMCLGEDEAAVRLALDLANNNNLPQTATAPNNDIEAFIDLQALIAALTTEEGGPFQKIRNDINKGMGAAMAPGMDTVFFSSIMGIEFEAIEALSQQVKSVSGAVAVNAENIRIDLRVGAIENTPLAAYLASVPQGIPATLSYLPDDTFAVIASRMGDMKPMLEWMTDFQAKIAALAGEQTPEETAALSEYNAKMLAAYGDDFSMAMRRGDGLRILAAVTTTDPQVVTELNAGHIPEGMNLMASTYKKMGLTITMEASEEPVEYAGHSIWQWRMPMEWTPPEDDDPEAQMEFQMKKDTFDNLFKDGFEMNWTLLGNDWLMATGPDSLDTIKNVIDKKQASLLDTPLFKNVMAKVPAETQGIALVHLTDILDMQVSSMREKMVAQNPAFAAMMPVITFERGPGLLATLSADASGMACTVTIPSAEIKSIVDALDNEEEEDPEE